MVPIIIPDEFLTYKVAKKSIYRGIHEDHSAASSNQIEDHFNGQ